MFKIKISRARGSFTPEFKAQAVAERAIRTMKEECIWLQDWASLAELQDALDRWCTTYNEQRPHQSLKWRTPAEARGARRELREAA